MILTVVARRVESDSMFHAFVSLVQKLLTDTLHMAQKREIGTVTFARYFKLCKVADVSHRNALVVRCAPVLTLVWEDGAHVIAVNEPVSWRITL